MKNCLLILFLSLGLLGNSQTWSNLTYNPNQPDLELNPLKGFASLWQPTNTFPHSIQGTLIGLDDVMIGLNNFDWTIIDDFLAQEASEGNHAYLQVNIDPAFGTTDMPPFLINQVDWEYYNVPNNVADSCPDWNDPELMEAMLNFIDAFGVKYNNDPRVFLVHLGLYGMWGEWHIGNVEYIRPEFAMTKANKTLIANAYKAAFPDKHLLARYPENMPNPQTFGYSDGLFFGQSLSGWNPFYFHNTLKNHFSDENWRLHPIGGEIDPALQPTIWQDSPNIVGQDVQDCFDFIHPTWLFTHHVLTVTQPGTAEWDNAIAAQRSMGYNFYLRKFHVSAINGNPSVEVIIENTGVAPMYANWDVEVGVLDANNQFQSLGVTNWNLSLIQPGSINNYRSFASNATLVDGTYTFMIKVLNPLEANSAQAQPVRFANFTQDQDLSGWITLGQETINSGNVGVSPVAVSGFDVTPLSATVQVGDSLQLVGTVTPGNATNSGITWVSSHPATASVDATGLVITGPKSGTVAISSYTHVGDFIGESILTVEPIRSELPAVVEAEDFLEMSGMAIQSCGTGCLNLGYIDIGDCLEYAVSVDSAANFFLDFVFSSQNNTGQIALLNENNDTLSILDTPVTGLWATYDTITSSSFVLPQGEYTLSFYVTDGGFNMDWMEFRLDSLSPDPSASIFENELSSLKVYPNPTKDKFSIEWKDNTIDLTEGNWKLSTVLGVLVDPVILNKTTIDIGHLPNGIYFLELEIEGQIVSHRVIRN